MRYPAFHRPNAMLATRCACVFSCDLIFTSKFSRLPDTPLAHSFCIADGWTSISFDNVASSSVVRSRAIGVRFPQPQNVRGSVFFREHVDRIHCYFLGCPLTFRLSPLCWLRKSSGFYSCWPTHCPVDVSSLVVFAAPDAYGHRSN